MPAVNTLYLWFKTIREDQMSGKLLFSLLRIGIVSLLAFGTIMLVDILLLPYAQHRNPIPYAMGIIAFNLVSEGNVFINRYLDKTSPWFFKLYPRIIKQLLLSLAWTTLMGIIFYFIVPTQIEKDQFIRVFALTFIFGAIFVLIFNSILFLKSFFVNWKQSFFEMEKLKQEKLKSDFLALQNQMNPHFLFNCLSVLISEIHFNPPKAEEFTRKMSEVYRYVLQRKNDMTVTLKKELQFLDNFTYLHKIRLGNAFFIEQAISDDFLSEKIPPQTLQLLVENALKHNRSTEKEPLYIHIESTASGTLIIRNNLQERRTTYSTETGLTNLAERYQLICGKNIRVEKTDNEFIVEIPLIE
ncbi:histidine kinase [Marinilabiliaceae bacterium JC017]|nr:histidine kinase [Marinilabiliaceae bacterium JC017]